MKPCLLGFGNDRLDPVGQGRGGDVVVARYVVESNVAEAALLPVTTMGNRELVPTAVGPQPVHRVEHVEERQIAVQRQPVPSRRPDFSEWYVGLMAVDVADCGLIGGAKKGAYQFTFRSIATQVFEQR